EGEPSAAHLRPGRRELNQRGLRRGVETRPAEGQLARLFRETNLPGTSADHHRRAIAGEGKRGAETVSRVRGGGARRRKDCDRAGRCNPREPHESPTCRAGKGDLIVDRKQRSVPGPHLAVSPAGHWPNELPLGFSRMCVVKSRSWKYWIGDGRKQ